MRKRSRTKCVESFQKGDIFVFVNQLQSSGIWMKQECHKAWKTWPRCWQYACKVRNLILRQKSHKNRFRKNKNKSVLVTYFGLVCLRSYYILVLFFHILLGSCCWHCLLEYLFLLFMVFIYSLSIPYFVEVTVNFHLSN